MHGVLATLIVCAATLGIRTALFSPAIAIVSDCMIGTRTLRSSTGNRNREWRFCSDIRNVIRHNDIPILDVLRYPKRYESQLALCQRRWFDPRRRSVCHTVNLSTKGSDDVPVLDRLFLFQRQWGHFLSARRLAWILAHLRVPLFHRDSRDERARLLRVERIELWAFRKLCRQ